MHSLRGLHWLQKISMSLMGVLVLITFLAANLHAILWQSSEWLVSTVLPAVVVQLTNDERADIAAAPLQRNSVLDKAAQLKAEDMAKNEYFAHYSPDGVSPWHWFDEAGYVYAHAGENLAIHFTDSSEVVEAWMNSPTHRQNIVGQQYTEIGVGTAKGTYEGYDTVYVVQLFGAPAVAPEPVEAVVTPEPEPVEEEVETEPVVASEEAEETVLASETESSSVPDPVEVPSPQEPVVQPEAVEEPVVQSVESESTIKVEETTPEPESLALAEPVPESPTAAPIIPEPNEVVVIERPVISTSSGLAIANITTPNNSTHAGGTLASIATQPNTLLQILYVTLGSVVFFLLIVSVVVEARRLRFVQVAYGVFLIFGMGGLWFMHSLLTDGAVVV